MANLLPLRIYFGWFMRGTSNYADNASGDVRFPAFLNGQYVGAVTERVHTRRPIVGVGGSSLEWDEYVDLYMAALDVEKAGKFYEFRDTLNVATTLAWQPLPGQFSDLPTNLLTLETTLNEFLGNTAFISLPEVTAVPKPKLAWGVECYAGAVPSDFSDTVTELWITQTDATVESDAVRLRVRKLTASNTLSLRIYDALATGRTFKFGRTDLVTTELSNDAWSDFPREVTGYTAYNFATAGSDPDVTVTTLGGGWYQIDIADFFSSSYSSGSIVEPPAQNPVLSRVAHDYSKRHRIYASAPFNYTQTWLVLNSETRHYYKGLLEAVSPVFLTGVGKRTEDTAQVVLRVLEEGAFIDAAWNNPNETTYFIPWSR